MAAVRERCRPAQNVRAPERYREGEQRRQPKHGPLRYFENVIVYDKGTSSAAARMLMVTAPARRGLHVAGES